jgi:hypothetical protein
VVEANQSNPSRPKRKLRHDKDNERENPKDFRKERAKENEEKEKAKEEAGSILIDLNPPGPSSSLLVSG